MKLLCERCSAGKFNHSVKQEGLGALISYVSISFFIEAAICYLQTAHIVQQLLMLFYVSFILFYLICLFYFILFYFI